jgi:DNA-binding XRE family transcriptional regulator
MHHMQGIARTLLFMPGKEELVQYVAFKVKALRREANLSQEQLVEDTGLNIGLIEMGNTNVTIYTLCRLPLIRTVI